MKFILCLIAILVFVAPISAFMNGFKAASRVAFKVASTAVASELETVAAPDFYWQYRLDRLVSKKGAELSFDAKNYPEAHGFKNQYDAYYLDLVLQGKLGGFNWREEKEISDDEWVSIYDKIADWSEKVDAARSSAPSALPENDFDLVKLYYPHVEFKELETPFGADEVGTSFPYKNMKELLSAAAQGNLKIPGYSGEGSSDTIVASETRAALEALKVKSLAKVDAVYADALKQAQLEFPDEQSRAHYKALQSKLASFPQSDAAWATFSANMEKEVDEMARLAAKKEDPHHAHHEEGEEGHHEPSPKEQFQAKYGLNLDELQEISNKFKADPDGFFDKAIEQKFGKVGLEAWKKALELDSVYDGSSPAEIAAAEASFKSFLSRA